jgi:hypothetical protein
VQYPPPIAPPEPTPAFSLPADAEEVVCRIGLWREIWSAALAINLIFVLLPSVDIVISLFFLHEPPAGMVEAALPLLLAGPVFGLFCGLLMALSQSLSPIRLNRRGIYQENRALAKINWEDVTEVRLAHFLWFYEHLQIRHKNGPPLSLPIEMSRRPDFAAAVERLAPKDNPLRVMIEPRTGQPIPELEGGR